jgi:uncharacterized protein (UPF0332 family)
LLLKLEDMEFPQRHHSEVWRAHQDGSVAQGDGQRIEQGFELRNQARYERHASIGEDEAKRILALADQFIDALSAELRV